MYVDGLLPAPAERVQAGVDDEPAGAHRVGGEHPHPVDRPSCRGPSRRRAARCRGPSPRRRPRCGCACGTPARRASSLAMASCRWWPGMPSWKAIDSQLEGPPRGRVVDVDEERAAAAAVAGRREVERLGAGHRRLHGARAPAAAPRTSPASRPTPAPSRSRRPRPAASPVLEVQLGVGAHGLEDLLAGRRCRPPRGRARGTRRRASRSAPARCRGSPARTCRWS